MNKNHTPEISIIIPTYNERENLPQLIQRIETAMNNQDHEIIIVDDNSPDGTGQLAEQLAKQYGNIKVIHRFAKMGLATAILTGIKHAEGDIIAVMDADLQHPPELLPKLHQAMLKGNDIAIASRYTKGGKIEGWSLKRKIISKGAIALAHLFLPQTRKIKDPMSGYFTLKKELLQGIELNPTGYKILLEIVAKTKPKKIAEIPYTFKPRTKGKSKLSMKEIAHYIKHLTKLTLKR
ncbi:MAG: polyprenol monophosphomannose synthase [archaeon GB-1867-005]|nr:polyprenol monophosphomannose synthase [Candidatus Culexmicrobium cathedralense]